MIELQGQASDKQCYRDVFLDRIVIRVLQAAPLLRLSRRYTYQFQRGSDSEFAPRPLSSRIHRPLCVPAGPAPLLQYTHPRLQTPPNKFRLSSPDTELQLPLSDNAPQRVSERGYITPGTERVIAGSIHSAHHTSVTDSPHLAGTPRPPSQDGC